MTGVGPTNIGNGVPPAVEGLCCNYNFLVDSPAGLQANFPAVQFTGINNQVELFKSRLGNSIPDFNPNTTLFYVQGGYNDVFLALALSSNPLFDDIQRAAILQAYTINAALNMGTRIAELAALDAENFLVVNMFDLGRMPFAIASGLQPVVTPLTLLFDSVLHSTLGQLRADLDLNIIEFDAFAELERTIASGAFSNTTESCFDSADVAASLSRIYGGCQGYLFFDGAHPTTAAYQMSAAAIAQAIPEPPSVALIAAALLALVWTQRRRRTCLTCPLAQSLSGSNLESRKTAISLLR